MAGELVIRVRESESPSDRLPYDTCFTIGEPNQKEREKYNAWLRIASGLGVTESESQVSAPGLHSPDSLNVLRGASPASFGVKNAPGYCVSADGLCFDEKSLAWAEWLQKNETSLFVDGKNKTRTAKVNKKGEIYVVKARDKRLKANLYRAAATVVVVGGITAFALGCADNPTTDSPRLLNDEAKRVLVATSPDKEATQASTTNEAAISKKGWWDYGQSAAEVAWEFVDKNGDGTMMLIEALGPAFGPQFYVPLNGADIKSIKINHQEYYVDRGGVVCDPNKDMGLKKTSLGIVKLLFGQNPLQPDNPLMASTLKPPL